MNNLKVHERICRVMDNKDVKKKKEEVMMVSGEYPEGGYIGQDIVLYFFGLLAFISLFFIGILHFKDFIRWITR